MVDIDIWFKKIKDSKDSEQINEFLLEISRNPQAKFLSYVEYFIEHLDPSIIPQVKLNIVFLIGSIGELNTLTKNLMTYLVGEYYKSDMWVRKEILDALEKISHTSLLPEGAFELLKRAIHEDYTPIKNHAFTILGSLEFIPKDIKKEILRISTKSMNPEITEQYSLLLRKSFPFDKDLFKMLSEDDISEKISKNSVRTILISCFDSVISLESFRKLIEDSQWTQTSKETFFREIDIYEKILLGPSQRF